MTADLPRTDELPRTGDLPRPTTWAQRVLTPVAHVWYGRRYPLDVHGRDRVPRRGPVLVAANHLGYVDGPLVALACPRPSHSLVKAEMFRGGMGVFLRAMGQMPVDRGVVDVRAVRTALHALRHDRVVTVFPEARRGPGDMAIARRGLAYLALVSGAPVVPVAVLGTREPGASIHVSPPRGTRVVVAFGEPVAVAAQPWPRRRREVGDLTERLRETLAAHVTATVAATGIALPGRAPDQDDDVPDEIGAAP